VKLLVCLGGVIVIGNDLPDINKLLIATDAPETVSNVSRIEEQEVLRLLNVKLCIELLN
jgi:hypothetical protein